MNKQIIVAMVLLGLLIVTSIEVKPHAVSSYTPQKGDYFHYSETITVNNGQGSYAGYTDQTNATGSEQITKVKGSVVTGDYNYSFQYSNNQRSSTSNVVSGTYTWSSKNYTYLNGTDNQVGYSPPVYVWFDMNASTPNGGSVNALNNQFTVISRNYTLQLPTENKYVQTVETEATGQYQRNDSYGVFNATFTWYEYYDPTTGYIVGYNYVEQDSGEYGGQAGSFTYTDVLYVVSTSYGLTVVSAPTNTTQTTTATTGSATSLSSNAFITTTNLGGQDLTLLFDYGAAFIVIVFVIAIAAYAATRRRGKKGTLPQHPYTPYTSPSPPSSAPFGSQVDMGSKPPEEVVIRDVAKVKCKYCGTLIPSTAGTCPYCGAPVN